MGINGLTIKDFGGPGLSVSETGSIVYEMCKIDVSFSTFVGVQNSLGLTTLDLLGSEEQRARFLPDGIALKTIWAWALTEPGYGSNASGLQTVAKKVEGGYLLTGEKRWIGNATIADYIIVFAKNLAENGNI